jgi:hypothetical protein
MYSSSQGPPNGVGLDVKKLTLYLTPKGQSGNLHPFVKFYTIVIYARHNFIYLFTITCIMKTIALCKTFVSNMNFFWFLKWNSLITFKRRRVGKVAQHYLPI